MTLCCCFFLCENRYHYRSNLPNPHSENTNKNPQMGLKYSSFLNSCWSFIPRTTWCKSCVSSQFNSWFYLVEKVPMKDETTSFYQPPFNSWCQLEIEIYHFRMLRQFMYHVFGYAPFILCSVLHSSTPHPFPSTSFPLIPFFSRYCHPWRFTRSPLRCVSGHKSLKHTVKAHPLGWI